MKKLLIIGCGWLGFPLGKQLARKGWQVRGTTTTESKKLMLHEAGIEPFTAELQDNYIAGDSFLDNWPEEAFILINVPPSRQKKTGQNYVAQMQFLKQYLQRKIKQPKVVFVSSTTVYNTTANLLNKPLTEQANVAKESDLYLAEQVFADWPHTITLRMSGLAGYNRVIGRYFAGKTEVPDGKAKVNLIHRDDAVNMMEQAILQTLTPGIYNVTAPEHPSRQMLFLTEAARYNFEPPVFSSTNDNYRKVIDGSKIINELNYRFCYPDPISFPVK